MGFNEYNKFSDVEHWGVQNDRLVYRTLEVADDKSSTIKHHEYPLHSEKNQRRKHWAV